MDLSRRINKPEIMDTQTLPPLVMRKTLSFLETTNRYFGGIPIVLDHFNRWSARWDKQQPIRILDVGTGSADIPAAIAVWAHSAGFRVEITGIDLMDDIATIAAAQTKKFSEIRIEKKDLFDCLTSGERFDYVIASLFLHHVPPEKMLNALRAFDQLATRGILISDLLRTPGGYRAVTALSWLIGNRVVRHDGPLSVRRAFLPEELNDFAKTAGFSYLTARVEPWFRVSLSGEKV